MMDRTRTITGRKLDEDPAGAMREAKKGPVFIKEGGAISYVLMTKEDFDRWHAIRDGLTTDAAETPRVPVQKHPDSIS